MSERALGYASLFWRTLPLRGKEPLTRHGVKNASSDPRTIVRWYERWPDADVGIATGAPGPQVLDIDQPGKLPADLDLGDTPTVATARGTHHYFAGQGRATVKLAYGELRGLGSYVVAPPSLHPSGREYVWLLAPRLPLPPVPALLASTGSGYGSGEQQPLRERVKHGERHPYLADFTVRLIRAGVLDRERLIAHLRLEFGIACEQQPGPQRGYFEALVNWGLHSRMAARERDCAEFAEQLRALGDRWWSVAP